MLAIGIAAIAFSIAAFVLSGSLKNEDSGPLVTSRRENIVLPAEEAPAPAPEAALTPADIKEQAPAKKDAIELKPAKEPAPEQKKEAVKKPVASDVKNKKETEKKPVGTETKDKKEKTAKKPEQRQNSKKDGQIKPWVVNISSFAGKAEAEAFIKSLKSKGYTAYRTEFKKNKRLWHRVRVGFFSSIKDAKKTGALIEKEFHVSGSWVAKVAREEADQQK